MPTMPAARLREIIEELLHGAGASPEEAGIVARHSVDANLVGHDSHGVIQIITYVDRIERGHIVPGAPVTIERETPTSLVVDGNWGFGYVVTEGVVKQLIEKAATQNVAAATVYRQSHIGRLGAYAAMGAEAGMITMLTADSGRSPKHVAPFGGKEARLGTNPICLGVPSDLDGAFCHDMATSAVAAGKVKLAEARGAAIPEGWVVDKDGKPTTDPTDYGKGGVLLPLGGPEGHKGYGLSAMVEVFSGLLTGLGYGVEPSGRHNDGCFIAMFNVAAFRQLHDFKREVADFAHYLKSTPPQDGVDEVYYPGEIEHRRRLERDRDGVPIDDAVWQKLHALCVKYDVAKTLGI